MKEDTIKIEKRILTFSKNELIQMMIEKYQKNSGKVLPDVDKKKCELTSGRNSLHGIELTIFIEETSGEDYNGL
jgi:hypothetical protein